MAHRQIVPVFAHPAEVPILDAEDEVFDVPQTRLDELDRTEFYDVAHAVRPDLTLEDYEEMWEEATQAKAQRRALGERQ